MIIVMVIIALVFLIGYFLGAIFQLPLKKYDGSLIITEQDGLKTYCLELDSDPEELDHKKIIRFKGGSQLSQPEL